MVYKILTVGAAAMLALTGCTSDDPDRDDDRINIEAPAKEGETRENQAGEGDGGPLKPGAWEALEPHLTLVDEYTPPAEDLDD